MNAIAGRRITLSGSLTGMSRAEFKQKVTDAGGEYRATLDGEVDYLVAGEAALPNRVEQARKLGVKVIDEAGFHALFDAASPDARAAEAVPLAEVRVEDAPVAVAHLGTSAVRVLDVRLPRVPPGPFTPPAELFEVYTLDARTLALLRFIARAVRLRQPCLIEGDTATSKTSAVLYLAALTGHQVVRINLNGQTDTSELVGRYVPNTELPVSQEDLLEHLDLLEHESKHILERARDEERALTAVEAQQIAANERIERPQWRWQEGLIPQAMRHGWWVILDEVNLAEPQVLERLNATLERDPTLVLTEGPGTRFGAGGDVPVHPDFRVFGTMNPAEYQGRSVLSPAWKDRWVAHYHADPPGEVEYRQMLERLVFGRQPDAEVGGLVWSGGPAVPAPYRALASAPHIRDLLNRLAALHTGLVRMATPAEGKAAALGAGRRERYVFSRRGLLGVLDALADGVICDPTTGENLDFASAPEQVGVDALESVYLHRLRGEEDRAKVLQLLRSLGLWRGQWLVGEGSAA